MIVGSDQRGSYRFFEKMVDINILLHTSKYTVTVTLPVTQ